MKKFYSCEQKPNESVQAFATRLEDLFDKAVNLHALKGSDKGLLKDILHSGLKKELKTLTLYQKDRLTNYDVFKRELRKIEADMKGNSSPEPKKHCKPIINTEKKEKESSEFSEMKEMMKQLHDKIDRIEREKDERKSYEGGQQWYGGRGMRRGNSGNYPRGHRGGGRGNYTPNGPIGG